jgi:septum formation protein
VSGPKTQLVLASTSPTRAAVLRGAGVDFEAVASHVNEEALKEELLRAERGPAKIAQALAEAKALAVAWERDELVIGCDQTLDLHGTLFDKAESIDEARDRLKLLRGKTHELHSAVVVTKGNDVKFRELDTSRMTMRDFSDAWLEGYLARQGGAILGSVGCYQLEGEGAQMFDQVVGDYFSILGLPLYGLLGFLREQGLLAT